MLFQVEGEELTTIVAPAIPRTIAQKGAGTVVTMVTEVERLPLPWEPQETGGLQKEGVVEGAGTRPLVGGRLQEQTGTTIGVTPPPRMRSQHQASHPGITTGNSHPLVQVKARNYIRE